jgi:hypothetical protein
MAGTQHEVIRPVPVSRTYREWIPSRYPFLKRHVLHDELSRWYEYDTSGLTIQSVRWTRRIPVLDQGQVGSCTANAGIGCLGTDPYYPPSSWMDGTPVYTPDEPGAVKLYSDEEVLDGDGPYPPNDNGSTGLTCAKVLKRAGMISGYQHTFSLDAALKTLSATSFITGINWYEDMFNPDAEGIIRPTGELAGGHEIVVDEYDQARGLVGFTNSWGASWGLSGRFYMAAEDWGTLLDQQGDVTILVPLSKPSPNPKPGPQPADPDEVFAAALRQGNWVDHRHAGANAHVASAAKDWLREKNL